MALIRLFFLLLLVGAGAIVALIGLPALVLALVVGGPLLLVGAIVGLPLLVFGIIAGAIGLVVGIIGALFGLAWWAAKVMLFVVLPIILVGWLTYRAIRFLAA